MGSLTSALERLASSKSFKKYYSQSDLGRSSIQRVYLAFAANRDMCLSFLRQCADYGEEVIRWPLPSVALPTSLCMMASHDLRERIMRLRSEMTRVSGENTASVQGLSSYQLTPFNCYHRHKCLSGSRKLKATHKQALSLERKMTSGLNTLLEKFSSCVMVTDGLPDDALPTLKQLREVWEKARYSACAALAILEGKPAPQLFFRSPPLVSTRLRSVTKRWMMDLERCLCL
jgi:hypothetical protein